MPCHPLLNVTGRTHVDMIASLTTLALEYVGTMTTSHLVDVTKGYAFFLWIHLAEDLLDERSTRPRSVADIPNLKNP